MVDLTQDFKIWIPRDNDKIYFEIKAYDSNNVEYNLKSNTVNFKINWSTIRGGGLAGFTIAINNSNNQYLDVFSKGNLIKFYFDYSDGTTLYKTFKMEEPKYGYENGYKIFLHGRDYPEIADRVITVDYSSGFFANNIFDNIVTNYFSGIVTTTGVDTDMTDTIYPKYEYQRPITIFKDVLERVDYDGRFENDGTITTFEDTGESTTSEVLTVGQNVKSVSGFGVQSDNEKNRILVVGKNIENMPILRMKENKTEQGKTWIKDLVYKNSDVITLDDSEDVATFMLSDKKTLDDEGTITSLGLATIKPGQSLLCSIPNCKIIGSYFIKKVIQSFTSGEGWITTVDVNQTKKLFSEFFDEEKKTRERERDINNPNFMSDTLILLTFSNENDIDSLGNVEVGDGKLSLSSGQDTGNMISDEFEADENFNDFEIRAKHNDDCRLCTFYVSNDNGSSYTSINIDDLNTKKTLTTTGKKGRLKVQLKSDATNPEPEMDSVALLIKRT